MKKKITYELEKREREKNERMNEKTKERALYSPQLLADCKRARLT